MPTTINPSDQTITQYNIQTGGASNLLNNVAPSATSGVPVISQGSSSQPVFGTAVVAGGGTGQVTLTNHGVLVGAATSAITQLAAGSAGQVLQSGGASADPAYSTATFPATATGTGKILRADGTNWVATTATYPDTAGTSGNVLTSDGTNWSSSAAPSSPIQMVSLNLTNAQCKALATTAVTLLANQGSGKVIVIVQCGSKLLYGGTNAFTGGGNVELLYSTSSGPVGAVNVATAAEITQTTSNYGYGSLSGVGGSAANMENQPIVIFNAGSAIAGNAANNNTITFFMAYYILSV